MDKVLSRWNTAFDAYPVSCWHKN